MANNAATIGTGTFNKGKNAGTATCVECGQRRQKANIDPSTGLCPDCYEQAGLENEHQDAMHEGQPDPKCKMCQDSNDEAAPQATATTEEGNTEMTTDTMTTEAPTTDSVIEEATAIAAAADAAPVSRPRRNTKSNRMAIAAGEVPAPQAEPAAAPAPQAEPVKRVKAEQTLGEGYRDIVRTRPATVPLTCGMCQEPIEVGEIRERIVKEKAAATAFNRPLVKGANDYHTRCVTGEQKYPANPAAKMTWPEGWPTDDTGTEPATAAAPVADTDSEAEAGE